MISGVKILKILSCQYFQITLTYLWYSSYKCLRYQSAVCVWINAPPSQAFLFENKQHNSIRWWFLLFVLFVNGWEKSNGFVLTVFACSCLRFDLMLWNSSDDPVWWRTFLLYVVVTPFFCLFHTNIYNSQLVFFK